MKRATLLIALLVLFTAGAVWAAPANEWLLQPYLQPVGPLADPVKAAPPQVGETLTFWGWDLSTMPPANRQFTATCRGVSDHGYVFVEDAQWNSGMNQADVDAILLAWDVETPPESAHPDQGIYDIETSLFGEPPDVDGWPGIVLLYYEIGCFMGQCFDGFYRYLDQSADPYSNEMDMRHLEAKTSEPGSEYMLGVTAHEFNHMLQMKVDINEDMWLSEALAEAAMLVTGYNTDTAWLDDYTDAPGTISFWGEEQTVHYGAALLMGTYAYEIGDAALLQALVADTENGIISFEDQLLALDLANSFAEFFGDMAAAIAADYFVDRGARDVLGPFHYLLLNVDELNWADEKNVTATPFDWAVTLIGGSLSAIRCDLQLSTDAVELIFSGSSGVEAAVIEVTADELNTHRLNVNDPDWPSPVVPVKDPDTVLLVLANPWNAAMEVSVNVNFVDWGFDDDNDDNDDNDASDDDDADDDDDTAGGAGDDDDDDSGCGCK